MSDQADEILDDRAIMQLEQEVRDAPFDYEKNRLLLVALRRRGCVARSRAVRCVLS